MQVNNRCLVEEPYEIHKYTVGNFQSFFQQRHYLQQCFKRLDLFHRIPLSLDVSNKSPYLFYCITHFSKFVLLFCIIIIYLKTRQIFTRAHPSQINPVHNITYQIRKILFSHLSLRILVGVPSGFVPIVIMPRDLFILNTWTTQLPWVVFNFSQRQSNSCMTAGDTFEDNIRVNFL